MAVEKNSSTQSDLNATRAQVALAKTAESTWRKIFSSLSTNIVAGCKYDAKLPITTTMRASANAYLDLYLSKNGQSLHIDRHRVKSKDNPAVTVVIEFSRSNDGMTKVALLAGEKARVVIESWEFHDYRSLTAWSSVFPLQNNQDHWKPIFEEALNAALDAESAMADEPTR